MFNYKKRFGQNFITDNNLINKITSLIPITNKDLVIEVGPGNGALTINLVKKANHVLIYEIDSELEEILKFNLKMFNNYTLTIKDFLDVDIEEDVSRHSYNNLIFISNLPYYITTPIIKKFIDSNIICDYMVLMVQEEVANRFCASVGSREYSSLTVFLNTFYDIKKEMRVNRKLFFPVPNVDSAVVVMKKKDNIKIKNYEFFKFFIRNCFKYKRKTLRNNLKGYNLDIIDDFLNKYGLSLNNRAEDIGVDIFIELANLLSD